MFLFILLLIFAAYYGATYYAASWWIELARPWLPDVASLLWPVFFLLSSLPLASRLTQKYGTGNFDKAAAIGDYWLALILSSVLARIIVDTIMLALVILPLSPRILTGFSYEALSLTAFIVILFYGLWNARHPVVRTYNIAARNGKEPPRPLRAVAVSDLHLGGVIGKDRLTSLIARLNALNPDVAFLVGDNINDDVDYVAAHNIIEPLACLKAKFGVYAVLGNHEYIGGKPDLTIDLLQSVGVTVLRDKTITVADRFIVAGRDDISKPRHTGIRRKPLAELLDNTDRSLPVILLDHQPRNLGEAVKSGVTLQISGHTHKGQFFPLNYITAAVHENNWGLLKKGGLSTVVTSGYGTWGPPIRIGSRSEIVVLNIML